MKSKIKNIIMISILLLALVLIFAPKSFARVDFDGNEIIEFEDENLKKKLNGSIHWYDSIDTNGDGEISVVEMENIYGLSLSGNFTNLEPLKYAKNLYSLSLHNYTAENLDILNDIGEDRIKGVIELAVETPFNEESNLSDISAISNFTNLKSLNIYPAGTSTKTKISDITPIQNLTNLTNLTIRGALISDISCLEKLTNLRNLVVSYNLITNIDVISNFTNLQSLDVYNNQIADISAISNLTELNNVSLGKNKIKAIPDLSKIKKLGYITLEDNNITDASCLMNGIYVSSFILINNPIEKIELNEKCTVKYLICVKNKNLKEVSIKNVNRIRGGTFF